MATSLPTNVDATYADRSPGDALHQQHHDAVHEYTNTHDGAADPHPAYLLKTVANVDYEAKVSRTGATTGDVPTLQGDGTLAFGAVASGLAATAGAEIATSETTTSTTFVDLATVGPAATATIGASGRALVILGAHMHNNTAGNSVIMAFAVSGATAIAATDDDSAVVTSSTASATQELSHVFLLTGLAAGSTTFTAKYRVVPGGTGTFLRRRITVIPL